MKNILVFMLMICSMPNIAYAIPSVTEYAKCSGILIIAAAVGGNKKDVYMEDAKALEKKASKLKGYDKGIYKEISFDSSGNYMEMLKKGGASATDFWSDAGYCRGLAQ